MAIKNKHAATILRHELKHLKGALSLAAQDVKKNVQRTSTEFQSKVATRISDKPFQSMGIAVLSGMALAFLMRRKRKNYSE